MWPSSAAQDDAAADARAEGQHDEAADLLRGAAARLAVGRRVRIVLEDDRPAHGLLKNVAGVDVDPARHVRRQKDDAGPRVERPGACEPDGRDVGHRNAGKLRHVADGLGHEAKNVVRAARGLGRGG